MDLDCNSMRGKGSMPLPHCSPHPCPQSRGVNVFNQDMHIATDTVEPPVAATSRKRPPLLSHQFSKIPKFFGQIPTLGTSCKRPPLVDDRDHF